MGYGIIGFLFFDLNLCKENYFDNKVGDIVNDKEIYEIMFLYFISKFIILIL